VCERYASSKYWYRELGVTARLNSLPRNRIILVEDSKLESLEFLEDVGP